MVSYECHGDLKSLANWQFVQEFVNANNKHINAQHIWQGNPLLNWPIRRVMEWFLVVVVCGFPLQRGSNAESISIPWQLHVKLVCLKICTMMLFDTDWLALWPPENLWPPWWCLHIKHIRSWMLFCNHGAKWRLAGFIFLNWAQGTILQLIYELIYSKSSENYSYCNIDSNEPITVKSLI